MKKITLLIVFGFIAISSFGQRAGPGLETKKEWIESYKQAVYFGGLLKGLNNRDLTKRLSSIDKSFYNPVFFNLHEKSIEKGNKYLAELIRKDSIDREGRVAEPAAGRRPLLICLNFYSSSKLNEMANQEYLKWMKVPNKKKLIEEASIAY